MLSFLVLSAAAFAPAQPAPRPVAMVLDCTGEVRLQRAGSKERPLRVMDQLRPGDEIRAARDAGVMLFFAADGHREVLKPGARVKVEGRGCTPAEAVTRQDRTELAPGPLTHLNDQFREGRLGVEILRSPNGGGSPMDGSRVLDARPTLSWPPVSGAEGYRLSLFEGEAADEKKLLWETNTKTTTFRYPRDRKPLRQGEEELPYTWRVTARSPGGEEEVARGRIWVLPAGTIKELEGVRPLARSENPADVLLAALAYQAYEVHEEALLAFENLAKRRPESARVQAELARYYRRAGRIREAEAAEEKVRDLTGRKD